MKKKTFAEKQIETLYAHMGRCPLCQKKNKNVSDKIEAEHDLWSQRLSKHMKKCCKEAQKTENLCEIVQVFVDQDYRNLKGAKNYSKAQYNVLKDGRKKEKRKFFVKTFDSLILNKTMDHPTAEEAEILKAYGESGHAFSIYDMAAPIPDGIDEESKTICMSILLGFTQQEIADSLGITQPAIAQKLKKIESLLIKKPIQLPLYSEGVEK